MRGQVWETFSVGRKSFFRKLGKKDYFAHGFGKICITTARDAKYDKYYGDTCFDDLEGLRRKNCYSQKKCLWKSAIRH